MQLRTGGNLGPGTYRQRYGATRRGTWCPLPTPVLDTPGRRLGWWGLPVNRPSTRWAAKPPPTNSAALRVCARTDNLLKLETECPKSMGFKLGSTRASNWHWPLDEQHETGSKFFAEGRGATVDLRGRSKNHCGTSRQMHLLQQYPAAWAASKAALCHWSRSARRRRARSSRSISPCCNLE
jgi:hypothetical protein